MAAKKNLHHLYTAIRNFAETKSLALVNEYHSMLYFKKERFYGCFDTKEFHLYANLNQKENQFVFTGFWLPLIMTSTINLKIFQE